MKMHNRAHRLLAAALASLVLVTLLLPSAALAAETDTISIRTAADLTALSEQCALDVWSRGKTVSLEADIDLRGTDFSPIPTFGGTFEGNGHTISGLSLSKGVSCQGLFRYVQEGAVIRDLHVTGTVTAAGEQACIGGIAGSNAGTILDCSFRGTVEGKSQVGGIAGVNEAAGTIRGCTVWGIVTGEKSTGGVAGENSGILSGCTNKSAVNTAQPAGEESIGESLEHLNKEEVLDTTTDTGGIAGVSNGVIRSCRNEGTVGYAHVGYNVGGIAGRSSGYLENCANAGAVKGRKDVGGVAGQIAPNIRLIFSPDTIDELKEELDRLSGMVDDTLDHTDSSRDTISGRLDQLSGYARTASDSADRLADSMSSWAEGGIDTVNDAADTLADTLDRLEAITDGGEDALDTLADGLDLLEESLEQTAAAMGTGQEGLDALAGAMDDLRTALTRAKTGLDRLQRGLETLATALVTDDPEAARQALALLRGGATDLAEALQDCGEAAAELGRLLESGDVEAGELAAYQAAWAYLAKDGFEAAADWAAATAASIAAAVNGAGVDWEALQEGVGQITAAAEDLSAACQALERSAAQLRAAMGAFSDMSGQMEEALTVLAAAMDTFERAARDAGDTADEIHDLFADLSGREPVEFDKLGDDFHQAEDDLHGAVNGLGDQLDLLRGEMDNAGDTLSGDIRDLGDQFQVIADLILDAFSDAGELDKGDLWDDVSQERIDSTTLGKARGCTNDGPVEGDLNVGGIAGAMAVENDFDPEDDITEVGEKSLDFRYETRAILQECVNRGSVTSKKDAAGGAVGRMELGYVLHCENYGTIESSDGDYVGGIAGISRSALRGCWSKCRLSGGSYVGGIVGYGCELCQCVSLVSVEGSEGYTGSVAGDWDRADGILADNRFVENALAGVDGISYAGQAEPVAYAALLQEEGVPAPFRSLTVTYVVEDAVLSMQSYAYGEALSGEEIPAVPAKEGYCGAWADIGTDTVTVDHVVEAVYTPCTTTLASSAMRGSVHPVFLAEGSFDSQARLEAEQTGGDGEQTEQWTVALSGADGGGHTIRFTPPEDWEDISLSLVTDGGKERLTWEREGSCCVFTATGTAFTVEAARRETSAPLLWAIPAAALLAALGCGALVLRRRSARRKKTAHGPSPVQQDAACTGRSS